jgi:hypothetical protein
LTRHFAKLSISPESSDGFASVGTILPKEEATLLPGGLFAFRIQLLGDLAEQNGPGLERLTEDFPFDLEAGGNMTPMQRV